MTSPQAYWSFSPAALSSLTYPDGTTKVKHYRAGDIKWTPGERVESEILSDRAVEIIMVAPKVKEVK
jgi:hypothetical protein